MTSRNARIATISARVAAPAAVAAVGPAVVRGRDLGRAKQGDDTGVGGCPASQDGLRLRAWHADQLRSSTCLRAWGR